MSILNTSSIDRISKRHLLTIAIIATALTGLLLPSFFTGNVTGVHNDGLFELGNTAGTAGSADILGSGAQPGPDWADLFLAGGVLNATAFAAFGGVAASFIVDDTSQKGATDRTTFSGAGGSNKNNDEIAAIHTPGGSHVNDPWHWDAGNVPAKDDLVNVYAYAAVNASNGHLIVYSGFERLDESGDSHIDIELFQDDITLDDSGVLGSAALPCNDPGPDPTPCHFIGTRTVGDTIISMDFSVGGSFGSLTIRKWDGTQYQVVASLFAEGCNAPFSGHPEDIVCGFNNGVAINGGPWVNIDKSGDEVFTLKANAFTEFGFDATELVGDVCFTTIMGKTRSSQSFTAELKDFAGPTGFNICDASIRIGPDDVNEVNQPHTFKVNATKKLGSISSPADDGTVVTVTLTASNGASITPISDNCATGTVNGMCTVTFTSPTAGVVTGHASANITVGNLSLFRETDGTGANSGDAVKRFVDAFITIEPDDVNSVGENHTFKVTVKQNNGTGAGFVNVPDGTIVSVTLTDADGAVSSISSNTCATGTSAGMCTITFTSPTAGNVTGHASVTLPIDGVSVTRSTDGTGQNSGDAVKEFVSGSIRWSKVDNAGQLQGGATFEVCRTHNFNSDTLGFDPITPVCVTVSDDIDGIPGPGPDEDADPGEFLLSGLRLGRYTVDETVPPPGFTADPKIETVDLTIASPNAVIAQPFQNERPILKLTEFGYTNQPSGTPTSGVVSGTTTFTLKLKNFGTASTTYSGSLTVSVTGAGGGSLSCPGSPLAISGSVAPGEEDTFSLTCTYTNMADGAVITANLSAVTYTISGLTRTASGTPASISFTIQSD